MHWTYIPHRRALVKKQKFKPFRWLDFYFSNTPVLEENQPALRFRPIGSRHGSRESLDKNADAPNKGQQQAADVSQADTAFS